jgi:dTDP-6-deoxy-L-talose 4-dehydrogenase (NAD+)
VSGTILLTGATGFVGRQVLRNLYERGVPTRVIVRQGKESLVSQFPNIEKIINTQNLFAETSDWWQQACQDIDTVIHCAWYAESGQYLQSEKNLDCLAGTLQLAKGAAQTRVRRVVGIGTCFEYDLSTGNLSIETPLLPLTPYAGAKAAVFLALSQWLPAQSIEFAWCRLFYLHGEGEDARRLVPYIRSKISASEIAELTSGNQVRDFLDVRIAAELIVNAAMSNRTGAINICSGIPITVRTLAEQIADEYGRRDLLKFGARPDNLVDPPRVVGVTV